MIENIFYETESDGFQEIELITKANGNNERSADEKDSMIRHATIHYGRFLNALGFDFMADRQTEDTPRRVAKAWVNDLISGSVTAAPSLTTFPNEEGYDGLVVQTGIPVVSLCAHHNLPFTGFCSVGYVPGDTVIGLSKLNRTVDWFSRRPNMQESLTQQIWSFLDDKLIGNRGVIVSISSKHMCCSNRGIKHPTSCMTTNKASGVFMEKDNLVREEFFHAIQTNGATMNN